MHTQNNDDTEIRFVDVDLLKLGKNLLQVEIFEFVIEEVEAVLVQLRAHPLHLVHLPISAGVVNISTGKAG